MKHKFPEAASRLLIVFAILIGGFIGIRVLLPDSVTDEDIHVQATIERETAKPMRYAGSAVCVECHEQSETKKQGYHKNLSCETCHGTAKEHSENPTEIKPVAQKKREFCTHCHMYNPSRPTGFPQINPIVHNPQKPCIFCHNPHDPKPPSVPQECQACHAEIARTKAVSAHVLLECTTCHEVPNEHKVTPRMVKASIPAERSFCGKCHGEGEEMKDVPKVDFASHGEKYLCWQCHYPHLPEIE
ncbi:MAG: hypothetical protein FJ218_04235 [Ignavibacteria bacterium]|nr:hypothetical protein [Ignavibacteria bacterium]